MAAVRLDIVSDPVCPWCWLGKRRMDAALAEASEVAVDVIWRPFQLDPSIPKDGVPYRDYMRAKFADAGGADHFAPMRAHLEAAAPAAGIAFDFDAIPKRPNTLDAHRLMRWADGQGRGGAAAEALFAAFFKDLRDIGDPAVLTAIAAEIGLDAAVVADLLATDRDADAVRTEEARLRKLGVGGVPFYIADGRRALQGAQETAVMATFLRDSAAAGAAT